MIPGVLMMFGLCIYTCRQNKTENERREQRKLEAVKEVTGDVPPTYSQLVMRQEPPQYKESIMQVT